MAVRSSALSTGCALPQARFCRCHGLSATGMMSPFVSPVPAHNHWEDQGVDGWITLSWTF
jgi:hypothetical protein